MHNVCNICMPQAICDVISSIGIGIGAAAADSIGHQHSIGLTLCMTLYSGACQKTRTCYQENL